MMSEKISANNKKYFYITSTLPYVNAAPHLGHALEIIRTDVMARWKRKIGYEVFFNTGTDEHGQKIWEAAQKNNLEIQEYIDQNVLHFQKLFQLLNISYNNFLRTTDQNHIQAAQEMWKICQAKGFIYKKNYPAKYCVGCELEKQDSDLNQEGKCPDHPHRDLEIQHEENYFFAFSKLEKELLKFYKEHQDFVIPDFRFTEIKNFVEKGLQDFSISRLKSKMSWGVPVPGDNQHVMYVWFEALTSYISTLNWGGENLENFQKFWQQKDSDHREVLQYCGKDNLRQQSAIWQAMLLAAGIPNSTKIIVNGFILGHDGVKMSKSLGNVIDPNDLIQEFGVDALRCFLLKEISNFDDSPFSLEKFRESYNANLANGLGNQTSRILKLTSQYLTLEDVKTIITDELEKSEKSEESEKLVKEETEGKDGERVERIEKENLEIKHLVFSAEFSENLNNFDLQKALNLVFEKSKKLDEYIQINSPFTLVKSSKTEDQIQAKEILKNCLRELTFIAKQLSIFLPETSEKILHCIQENKTPVELFGHNLFERK